MTRELTRVGNASSLHASGRRARRVVEESREAIAAQVGASPAELIFTSGGTESDNLAIKGAFWSGTEVGRRGVATSALEHHAVLDSVAWLGQSASAEVSYIPVDPAGRIDLPALAGTVNARTALVSVMWANNEIGTLQPVWQVAAVTAEHGAVSHSDAVQAVGHIEVELRSKRVGPAELHGAQTGRALWDRCLAGASGASVGPDPSWRRSGARRAFRHSRCRCHSWVRCGPRGCDAKQGAGGAAVTRAAYKARRRSAHSGSLGGPVRPDRGA